MCDNDILTITKYFEINFLYFDKLIVNLDITAVNLCIYVLKRNLIFRWIINYYAAPAFQFVIIIYLLNTPNC